MSLIRWIVTTFNQPSRLWRPEEMPFYSDLHTISAGANFQDRWRDIEKVIDLRTTDEVLDVGCAEGLISLELAKRTKHVHGLDIAPHRIRKAKEIARERSITNASFSVGSIVESPPEPDSYDVTLLLSVLGKGAGEKRVGMKALRNLLKATRRQIILRHNVQSRKQEFKLTDILTIMGECDFDGIAFPRGVRYGNIIAGIRRGADARIAVAPPLVLVPTETLQGHPCLQGTEIGHMRDFL